MPKRENVIFEREGNLLIAKFNTKELSGIDQIEYLLDLFGQKIAETNSKYFILDFSNIDFISTIAINLLLVILKRMRMRGGDVYICGPNDQIRQVFELMQLDKLFNIYKTIEEAKEKIKS